MKDKKNFGKYIAEKRKELGLTQEELASKLYVIPTTISKWERGITYPDITVITNLCKELNISEHEFFIACDDEVENKEKQEIRNYRMLKKGFYYTLNIGYLIGLITCLICNLVIDHTLSWFFIVLVGIFISFTITTLPYLLKKNKYRWFKTSIIFTILVYLLLVSIYAYNDGTWLFNSFKIATFVFFFLWIGILMWIFTNIHIQYKISISLILFAIVTIFTNPFCEIVLNIKNQDSNISNIISGILMVISAIGICIYKIKNKESH